MKFSYEPDQCLDTNIYYYELKSNFNMVCSKNFRLKNNNMLLEKDTDVINLINNDIISIRKFSYNGRNVYLYFDHYIRNNVKIYVKLETLMSFNNLSPNDNIFNDVTIKINRDDKLKILLNEI